MAQAPVARWQLFGQPLQIIGVQDLHLRRGDIEFFTLMDDVIWRAYLTADKAHRKPLFPAYPLAEPDNPGRRSLNWMNNLAGHFAARGRLVQGDAHWHGIPEKKPHRRSGGVNAQREQG